MSEQNNKEYYKVVLGATYSMPYGQERGCFSTYEEAREYADNFNDEMARRYDMGAIEPREWTTASVEGPYKAK
ncbi:MAG: hypothetical protein K6G10_04795 [Butyrivibrio sp.]|nr:hypothetical protein [Butyrivibrio sp.]